MLNRHAAHLIARLFHVSSGWVSGIAADQTPPQEKPCALDLATASAL